LALVYWLVLELALASVHSLALASAVVWENSLELVLQETFSLPSLSIGIKICGTFAHDCTETLLK